jgi:hypothetical protein
MVVKRDTQTTVCFNVHPLWAYRDQATSSYSYLIWKVFLALLDPTAVMRSNVVSISFYLFRLPVIC